MIWFQRACVLAAQFTMPALRQVTLPSLAVIIQP